MKSAYVVTIGTIGLVFTIVQSAGAGPLSQVTGPVWSMSEHRSARLVDSGTQQKEKASQQGGIVNERSTGNEPMMGPGASGGPAHSAPGATDKTMKQPQKQQSRTMEQGGSAPEKSGGATAKADKQGSEEQQGSSGSGSSKSGTAR